MPNDNEPMDLARKQAAAAIQLALTKHNLLVTIGGRDTVRAKLPAFNVETGYWAKPAGVTSKPPRWLVWLEQDGNSIIARVPDAPGSERLMHTNTTNGRQAGVFVRVVPAIRQPSGQWHLHLNWEWTLFFVLPTALKIGSAAQVLEHFRPETGKFDYLYNTGKFDSEGKAIQEADEPDYIVAGLFTLLPATSTFQPEGSAQPITYGDATAALQRLINVSPLSVPGATPTVGSNP